MIVIFDLSLIDPVANQTHIILETFRYGFWFATASDPIPRHRFLSYWGA